MEPEVSLPYSQESATNRHPEQDFKQQVKSCGRNVAKISPVNEAY
jgi:hypothetical protein